MKRPRLVWRGQPFSVSELFGELCLGDITEMAIEAEQF